MAIVCPECPKDACCHFRPQQPDPYLKTQADMAPAKLGHLNRLVDIICCISNTPPSGLTEVSHDDTMTGDGTIGDPLSNVIKVIVIAGEVFFEVTNPAGAAPGTYRVQATL